jgi:hypothetical protein
MSSFLTPWGRREVSARFVCAPAAFLVAATGAFGLVGATRHSACADDVAVVAGATNYTSERKVAVAPDGTVAVVYVVGGGDGESVHAKISYDRGATWKQLPRLSRSQAFRPAAAFDSAGRLHVAWTELAGEARQVFYAWWQGGPEWNNRAQLSDSPGYAADAADTLHVVWYGFDGSQYQIYYRARFRSGSWSEGVQASRIVRDANSPAVAIGPDGVVHVAYYAFVDGALDVQYMTGGTGGWTVPRRVNPRDLPSSQPSLIVHGDGTPAVAFTAGSGDATWVAYSELRDRTWTAPAALSNSQTGGRPGAASSGDSPGASAPSLAAFGEHEAAVAYETSDGRLHVRWLAPGGSWSAPERLADGGAKWPSLSWAAFPVQGGIAPAEPATYAVWTATADDSNELSFAALGHSGVVRIGDERTPRSPWQLAVGGGAALAAVLALAALARAVNRRLLTRARASRSGSPPPAT